MGMTIDWYFDFISPFAYLQWQRLRTLDTPITYRPVLLAGLLGHHGQKGPAEIDAKRAFTYRHVQWKADRTGIALVFPPAHPFNPLPALRLCVAAGTSAAAIDTLFNHLWRDGQRGDDAASLAHIGSALGIEHVEAAIADPAVKAQLQANFDRAIAQGVFGVPTLMADHHLFWGEDATAMFEHFLADPARFADACMQRLDALPMTATRRQAQ